MYVCGMAHYRAGQMEQAIDRLERTRNSQFWPAARIALPLLALAYHEAGREEDAAAALQEAAEVLDEWTNTLVNDGLAWLPTPWFDYIEMQVIYREAHLQLKGEPAPPDDRLEQFEDQAERLLRGE
jgi:hypothetical protein